ncbi:MAG: glycosyltransferase [Lachnospiraceae bacterium]|nr:glycosyltransferase [Lachnospiraceae bacterium]
MKLVFVSNYINHHQIPLCEELYRLSDGEFVFLATEPMSEERKAMGWDATASSKNYVVNYFEDPDKGDSLIMDSEYVLFGGTENQELIIKRLEAGKFTVRYSERLYKTGRWKFVSPRGLKQKFHDHTRFRKSPVFLLCAGAYVAGDFNLVGAYPGKKLKFGYFPKAYKYEDVNSFRRKVDKDNSINILWAGRFIDWKHPEMMVELAGLLADVGLDFKITMVGNGELKETVENQAKENDMLKYMEFIGALSPEEVREKMLLADFFISTSDRQEGWGAVINEAMNSGCVTIAAKDIGAAPYLIRNGENGYMYKALDVKAIKDIIVTLAQDKNKRYEIGNRAYETIVNTWNAETAAKRLWDFFKTHGHEACKYSEGPLSKA